MHSVSQKETPLASDRRVAVITGAGQGLGRCIARRLATDGALVVVTDVNEDAARRVAAEIRDDGRDSIALRLDVADESSVLEGFDEIVKQAGGVHVLVNNAAIFSTITMKPFEQIGLDEWEHVLRVNLTGMFLCVRAAVPAMRAQRWGRILNLSSSTVLMGCPNYLHYVTSKSGVIGLTRALAREVGGDGITVNAVMPGATTTEVERDSVSPRQLQELIDGQAVPVGLTPDDIAAAVSFAASDDARLMTGQVLVVDGGFSFH